jgi:hypothetical protein
MAVRTVQPARLRDEYCLTASARIFTRFEKIYLAEHPIHVQGPDSLINQSTLIPDIVAQTSAKIGDFLREDRPNSISRSPECIVARCPLVHMSVQAFYRIGRARHFRIEPLQHRHFTPSSPVEISKGNSILGHHQS